MTRHALPLVLFLPAIVLATGRQAPSLASPQGTHAAAFDLVDRRSRELLWTMQCGQRVADLRAREKFGPLDSLGSTGHCVVQGRLTLGVILDADSAGTVIERMSVVELRDGTRYDGWVDSAALLARGRAAETAVRQGYNPFSDAARQFAPIALWPTGDSLQVWLLPLEVAAGQALGGEHGFLFSGDGRSVASEVNAFARFREFQLPDTGAIVIESSEQEVPLLSEMVLANMLNDAGRTVSVVTARYRSSLVNQAAATVWVHAKRP